MTENVHKKQDDDSLNDNENVHKNSTTTITLANSNSGLFDVSLITE